MTAASFGTDRGGGSRGETVSWADPAKESGLEWATGLEIAALAQVPDLRPCEEG